VTRSAAGLVECLMAPICADYRAAATSSCVRQVRPATLSGGATAMARPGARSQARQYSGRSTDFVLHLEDRRPAAARLGPIGRYNASSSDAISLRPNRRRFGRYAASAVTPAATGLSSGRTAFLTARPRRFASEVAVISPAGRRKRHARLTVRRQLPVQRTRPRRAADLFSGIQNPGMRRRHQLSPLAWTPPGRSQWRGQRLPRSDGPGAFPCLPDVGDGREKPAQLIGGRQFTSMIEGTADRSGNGIPTGIEVRLLTGRSAPSRRTPRRSRCRAS
jgi:hypothetical protein